VGEAGAGEAGALTLSGAEVGRGAGRAADGEARVLVLDGGGAGGAAHRGGLVAVGVVDPCRGGTVEAVDRRHLTYAVARETTNDTGLQISMDSFMRAAPRKHRRIPLRPFLDDDRHALLLDRLRRHRPDLLPEPPVSKD
jgi:hypothetical protein